MKKVFFIVFRKIIKGLSGFGMGQWPIVRVLYPKINSIFLGYLRPESAQVGKHRMFLDKRDSLNLSIYGEVESGDTRLFRELVKKGDTVLDVGANIGYYTLIAAECVGENGQVFAFEPDSDNFNLLQRNIKLNGYKNVIAVQKAVADVNERMRLFLSTYNTGDHRLFSSEEKRNFVEVEVIRLDDYFKDYNKEINIIKIDIQGSENRAFQGMSEILKKNKSIKIITELWPFGLVRFGVDPKSFLESIITSGFSLFRIDEKGGATEPVNIQSILIEYPSERELATNILCVRNPT